MDNTKWKKKGKTLTKKMKRSLKERHTQTHTNVRIYLPLFSTVFPSNSCCFCPVGFRCYNNIINKSCGHPLRMPTIDVCITSGRSRCSRPWPISLENDHLCNNADCENLNQHINSGLSLLVQTIVYL